MDSALAVIRCTIMLLLAAVPASCVLQHARLHPGPAAAGDWALPGGGIGNRGVADTGSITGTIDTLLWRRKTHDIASSEPIVHGGWLYFPGLNGQLEIIDARSGARLASLHFKGPVTGLFFEDSGFTVSTDQNERRLVTLSYDPLVRRREVAIPTSGVSPCRLADGSFVVAALNGEVARYDSLGKTLWTVDAKGPITAAPVLVDSVIILAAGRSVSARRVADGGQIWSHLASGAVLAAPAVDDRAYFGSTDSLVYAVNAQSGVMEWFFAAQGQITVSPVDGPKNLYVASNDFRVYALNKTKGDTLWSYNTGAPVTTRPTLAGTLLYVGTQTGELLILDAASGTLIKSFKLEGPAASPPVIAGGRIYISDTKRRLYCFGISTEHSTHSAAPTSK